MEKLELIIRAREKDLGGFSVRRFLPFASHRMVGPFVFFDHMGPAVFPPGQGLDVRPHPHIHLATVTYLFSGAILHRDSLGSEQTIEPGAINWMTAGHGIVHSERSPVEVRRRGGPLNGIQLWVALPEISQDIPPSFAHHPAGTLPEFSHSSVHLKLLLGAVFGRSSPVKLESDLFYADASFPAGAELELPADGRELGFYVVSGAVTVGTETVEALAMGVAPAGSSLRIRASAESRLMLFGGRSVGPRFIEWNFVSSSQENIETAKAEWRKGPGSLRFPKVPGDEKEFIPLD